MKQDDAITLFEKESMGQEWHKALASFFETETFQSLLLFLKQEYATKKIYPKPQNIFRTFSLTPLSQVKVVIVGQDPYHGEGQANGLCFSVENGIPLPPSLKNIYKEIENDCGIKKDFSYGDLESWARQGVLLLNSVLSVEANSPASHKAKGWENFTDTVIKTISETQECVVFILWGNFAQSKKLLIDGNKHLILEASHPSPFSAHSGFFGCKHFSKCNEYLKAHGEERVKW
jgi:uracil-DNA glycosylase